MVLLGIDLGTSSIKVSAVCVQTKQTLSSIQYPPEEVGIDAPEAGWAEQSPDQWWQHVKEAIQQLVLPEGFDKKDISAIGIAYQMHGLVLLDKEGNVLRPSIIWCDSRAATIGEEAFQGLGGTQILSSLLNSPGNFTASKLAWVKQNEPEVYERAHKMMLPGDFIGFRLTNKLTTTSSALSEGIFWDFQANQVSEDLLRYFGFPSSILPDIQPVFSVHGRVSAEISAELGIPVGTPVTYKAGDQPNNALSLRVTEPGEIAATAGTSGVIYAVSDQISYDPLSRVNSFAHVNHTAEQTRIGILLCINGTGILNRWIKENFASHLSYPELNQRAAQAPIGSDGITILPFGNGIERVLENKKTDVQIHGIDLNRHSLAHISRAVQEGIACSFQYGFELMQAQGVQPKVIRAGKANLFLSEVFCEILTNITQTAIELYDTDGAKGAALAAGVGSGQFANLGEALETLSLLKIYQPEPNLSQSYQQLYHNWLRHLQQSKA